MKEKKQEMSSTFLDLTCSTSPCHYILWTCIKNLTLTSPTQAQMDLLTPNKPNSTTNDAIHNTQTFFGIVAATPRTARFTTSVLMSRIIGL